MHIKPVFHHTPNGACQICFSHSILTQLKIPLAVLFISPIRMFLQEEIKVGFILKVGKGSHKVGGVQVHCTIVNLIAL
jgi:hypothetical protein